MLRRAARRIWTAEIGCIEVASLLAVGVQANTATWTTAADFESGILQDLDASSSPGQLRLTNIASPWVKFPGNPVLGPGSGWETDWVDSPSVLFEDGVYKMWYQGCVGIYCDIGYATSPDGLSWARSPSNPVLLSNATGWDQTLGNPDVIHDGSGYHMWYAGNGPLAIQIGYATSADGVVWTKSGSAPIFMGRQPWDSGATSTPVVVKVGATFVLYFSGHPGNYDYSLGRATSPDGINWTEDPGNPLMTPQFPWEEGRVHPTGLEVNASAYDLYYTGGLNAPQIGHATSSDGRTWTKDPANPVIALGGSASWDRVGVAVGKVVKVGGTTRLYYGGESASGSWRIGVATYAPGMNPPVYRASGSFVTPLVDSGSPNTTWYSLDYSGTAPIETNIWVTVRVGNTSIPDASWTVLQAPVVAPGPSPLHLPIARFAQVGAVLISLNESKTPALDQIAMTYSPPGPPPYTLFGLGVAALVVLAIGSVGIVVILVVFLVARGRPAMVAPLQPMSMPCSACGAMNPLANRFCSNCGQPIGGPPR